MRLIPRWLADAITPGSWQRTRSWSVVTVSLGGLLVAITVAGLVGLAINRNVQRITERAVQHDVELEDVGDDLRLAVLDLRHYYRDLLFNEVTPGGLARFQEAYGLLILEIDDLQALNAVDSEIPPAGPLLAMAEDFYVTVRPVLEQAEGAIGPDSAVSSAGLEKLNLLERGADTIDRFGDERAEDSLARVERATDNARLVLLSVLGGGVLIGAGLVWAAVRVFGDVRGLYEAQQRTAARLEEALQAKNDFIADASHELRTPLTVLRGNAEAGLAMERDCVHREILDEIVAESARMTRLVEDLLFLARSDAASVPLKIETVAAEPLLAELAGRAETLASEHGVTLTTALAGQDAIRVDVARIEQAVMILVDNATKYSPPGGRVSLATSSWHGEFVIEVADQGPGIPEDDLPLIFERFYRVDKARSRKLGGAGLGLSIAKSIVEAHGGQLAVQSRAGDGTKMRISLPVAATGPSARPSRARPAQVTRVGSVS